MSLAGKTLFVTGASRGIGLAIALRAARDGANVAIAAKTSEPHKHLPGTIYSAAKEIEAAGGRALPLIVDVRDEASEVTESAASLQRRIRDLCRAEPPDATIPPAAIRLYRIWFALGWPAFTALVAIFWLMVSKPDFI